MFDKFVLYFYVFIFFKENAYCLVYSIKYFILMNYLYEDSNGLNYHYFVVNISVYSNYVEYF